MANLKSHFLCYQVGYYQSNQMIDAYSYLQRMKKSPRSNCYTQSTEPISLHRPGIPTALPEQLSREIADSFPRRHHSFMGGHPVSITTHLCAQIFSAAPNRQSPYLVCQKSDGVRYLLVVARVARVNLLRNPQKKEQLYTQCYLVSRKSNHSLQSFVADVGISFDMDIAGLEPRNHHRYLVSVLDGELVLQSNQEGQVYRFLIFDGLVHLGRNICRLPLKQRLEFVTQFINCNEMLGMPYHKISVELKDFFRLSCRKFNVVQFLLQKYVKMLEHNNDGLIFNHQEKEYVVGSSNTGYIKWKPQELNTVDFAVVPNTNLHHRFGNRILDLYVGYQDRILGRYTRLFYTFTVVDEQGFAELEQMQTQNCESRDQRDQIAEDKEYGFSELSEFANALIFECSFEAASQGEKLTMQKLSRQSVEELRNNLMKQSDYERDARSLELFKQSCSKIWRMNKRREDKTLPNNLQTVKKIEQSIQDKITVQELVNKASQLNHQIYKS